jgi:transposase
MRKSKVEIKLTTVERQQLEEITRTRTAPFRSVQRARLILLAAEGMDNLAIAKEIGLSRSMVIQWRKRFAESRFEGLEDTPRSGKKPHYTQDTERRILSLLDTDPPAGYASWNGNLVAQQLGDVSSDQVWRVLRKHSIHLQRRHSWCVSTDPEFTQKAADIVGLYLDPPQNAVVISVDEKPAIQALERAQGWLRLPDGQALKGFNHEYKRHGTTTLFAALEVATGLVKVGHYHRRRRREFLDFMNQVVAEYPEQELHVILDNLNTHKPKNDRWLSKHPMVHFHYTPTHASWINQVECWFSILWRQALRGLSVTSFRQLRLSIDAFIEAYSQTAHPFEWTKQVVHPGNFKNKYSQLCK